MSEEGIPMATWQIKDAKNRFSELLEDANVKGPQVITRHGTERAVVLSIAEYRSLAAHKPDLKAYLLGGPKFDDFEIKRDRSVGRTIRL
jgi:prevent-host-death family protein